MIDPLISLAFAIHANKGVYALMVGSGISRAASIPTGWEVILDLTRKVARLAGDDAEPDPAGWYRAKFDAEPSYSELLAQLAKTPAERQQLLRGYFEPNEDDQEQGRKQPTAAHRAIAQLVKSGHVRVVLTTNFDRLMETALAAVGITPTVVSTTDALKGAIPITHSACTLVKLHGDYLDTRIRNTPAELEGYEPEWDALLDRVLDEFGLVICGWSGEWDRALASAIRRCASRRFTTYWAARGDLGPQGKELLQHRQGELISIAGADQFFDTLAEKVATLEEFDQPHPLSAQMAVAALKRYLPDRQQYIRLDDLVHKETEHVVAQLTDERFPFGVPLDASSFTTRVRQYEAASETLRDLLIAGCYWGEAHHRKLWGQSISRVITAHAELTSSNQWAALRAYPGVILFYAASMAALAGDDYETLAALFLKAQVQHHSADTPLAAVLHAVTVHVGNQDAWEYITGRVYTPASNHLFTLLRQPLQHQLPLDQAYQRTFDRLEYLLALTHADFGRDRVMGAWVPPGAFVWRDNHAEERNRTQYLVAQEIEAGGTTWPPLKAGLFGGIFERVQAAQAVVAERVKQLRWY